MYNRLKANPDMNFEHPTHRHDRWQGMSSLVFVLIVVMYNRLKANPNMNFTPRTVMIGGKVCHHLSLF